MTTITFVTDNSDKLERAQRLTQDHAINIQQHRLELPETQHIDVSTVSQQKAAYAREHVEPPFFVSDTGYLIDALDGFPGALLKPVLRTLGTERLCRLVTDQDDRTADFLSVLTYVDEHGTIKTFECHDTGRIAPEPRGEKRIGWGGVMKIHIPDGYSRTIASMTEDTFMEYETSIRKEEQYVKLAEWIEESQEGVNSS
ncbi:MAG: non-canonical purine NTP pyrophosphatase [Candidatus Nanohaloarchaea archaeon]|nr:non-canonical purine NTP pyrophosphatase [Candidatus Nanohaloarchaea archaeon]